VLGALSLGPPLAKGKEVTVAAALCIAASGALESTDTPTATPRQACSGRVLCQALLPSVSRRALVMTDAELRLMASAVNITLPVDLL
jgi:hypothetical protein